MSFKLILQYSLLIDTFIFTVKLPFRIVADFSDWYIITHCDSERIPIDVVYVFRYRNISNADENLCLLWYATSWKIVAIAIYFDKPCDPHVICCYFTMAFICNTTLARFTFARNGVKTSSLWNLSLWVEKILKTNLYLDENSFLWV